MTMTAYILPFISAMLTMGLLDAVWLSTMANRFYRPRIGHLMADSPNFAAAIPFYVIYIAALVVLVIQPAIANNNSYARAALIGAVYGIATYATYDLTNQATLRGWPTSVSVVDLAWGAFLTAMATLVSVAVTRYFA